MMQFEGLIAAGQVTNDGALEAMKGLWWVFVQWQPGPLLKDSLHEISAT